MKVELGYLKRAIIVASNAAAEIADAKKRYDKEGETIVDLNDLDGSAPSDIRSKWKSESLEIMCMMEIPYSNMDRVMEVMESLIASTYDLMEEANKYVSLVNCGSILSMPNEMVCIFNDAKMHLAYRAIIDILALKREAKDESH